jgi:hypothetical protein
MMEESSPGGDDGFRASFGAMALGGSGDSTKNPLFESDPSDTDERRRSQDDQTSPGGIGRGRTEAPESHLRRVRAGGLLTKLPSDKKGAPRVRFFRVTASDRELQWGDPADAASPTLGSRLLLHEVQSVARGHATRAFETLARADPKRAGPPAECFSLVALDDTCDLRGGDADDAALWAGALETLCARARRAHAVEQIHAPSPSARASVSATSTTPSPSAARAPATLRNGKPPTPPSVLRPDFSSSSQTYGDYHTGGGSGVNPNAGAEAATAFVPVASDPPAPLPNEGHVALAVSLSESEEERARAGATRRDRRLTPNAREPVGAVSRFAHASGRPPPLLVDEPATRKSGEKRAPGDAVRSSTPRAPLTARTYLSGGGEDLVEAFSRSRHGRAKELDALFSRGVDPHARDANGLTLLHIAAQNNQRKTAKLVLKRTDFVCDPPSRDMMNQQTNAGQTALHFAFAYGYHDLARWLVSLGADDGIVNVHGLSCYEGLDPDEPKRETLNAPEMLEMARRKRRERRAETLRPGTSVGHGEQSRYDEQDSALGGSARGPRSDSAYGGSNYSGRSDAYSVSSAGSGESPTGWDPRPPPIAHRGVPAAPMPSPPVAPVASPVAPDAFAHHPGHPGYPHAAGFAPPGSPLLFGHGYPPHPGGGAWSPQSAYGGMVAGSAYGDSVYGAMMSPPYVLPGVDPVAAAHFAAHQRSMMAPPYGFAGYVAPGPAFHAGGVPSAGDAPRPPSPIMRGVRRGGEDDSSNLDTSSDEAEDSKRGKTKTKTKTKTKPNVDAKKGFPRASREGDVPGHKKPARRRAGEARAAAALPAKRGGKGAADPDLDGRVAMRFAAMRRGGFHSSDSDDATSASEAERTPKLSRATSSKERAPVRVEETSETSSKSEIGATNAVESDASSEAKPRGGTSCASKTALPAAPEEARAETAPAPPGPPASSAYAAGAARREERRRARAEERSVLPPRLASKVSLVLNAAGVGDFSAVRDALLTGALGAGGPADWSATLRELCDAQIFPSAVDLVAIRAAYVDADTGAVRADRADRAGAADTFFLALLDVKRPAEKARALLTRETFADALDALVGVFDAIQQSTTRAASSERLDRLVEIALALGDILRKEEGNAETYAHFAPGGWRAGALKRLAASSSPRAGSAKNANLLRHLAKTVAAKSPDLMRVGEDLLPVTSPKSEASEAARRRRRESEADEREFVQNDNVFSSARARLAALASAVEDAAREAELSATGKDAAYGKKFARSLDLFLEQARAGLRRARAAEAQALESTETLREKFGPAPPGAAPEETLEALLSFVRAFETAAEETAAAKRARERERANRPG